MARGMPHHAKQLTDLLKEQEILSKTHSAFVISASSFLREFRDETGITQGEISRATGISQPYLSQIENGERTPSSETLGKLFSYVKGESSGNTNKDED